MNENAKERALARAWQRVDERLAAMRRRHFEVGDIPLYEANLQPPASERELQRLEKALASPIPFELAYSLRRWNGRWIAHDHVINFWSIADHLRIAPSNLSISEAGEALTFEEVIGPINPLMESRKRYEIGGYEYMGVFLSLDYEDPPDGGCPGQVICIGEEPVAEYVAPSFVDFLNLIADAPVYDDEPEYNVLKLSTVKRNS